MPLSVVEFWSAPSPSTEKPFGAPSAPGMSCTPGIDAASAARSPSWSAETLARIDLPLAAADVGAEVVVAVDALSLRVDLHGVELRRRASGASRRRREFPDRAVRLISNRLAAKPSAATLTK